MTEDTRCYVAAKRPGINGMAASQGQAPFINKFTTPIEFDLDAPAAYFVDNPGVSSPTIFPDEATAVETVEKFLARVRAVLRVAERTSIHRDIGQAMALLEKTTGSEQTWKLGGYAVEPYSLWEEERKEEARILADDDSQHVAAAERKARAAQEAADQLRAQRRPVPVALDEATHSPLIDSDWKGYDPGDVGPGIQTRLRKTGGPAYRGRFGGRVSPTFDTLAEAVRWRDAEAGAVTS